ncbi:hypothetical protein BLAT2472_30416 [Burkholderia latens]
MVRVRSMRETSLIPAGSFPLTRVKPVRCFPYVSVPIGERRQSAHNQRVIAAPARPAFHVPRGAGRALAVEIRRDELQ